MVPPEEATRTRPSYASGSAHGTNVSPWIQPRWVATKLSPMRASNHAQPRHPGERRDPLPEGPRARVHGAKAERLDTGVRRYDGPLGMARTLHLL